MNIRGIILTAASLTGSLGGGFLLDRYSMDRIILLSALLMLAVFLLQLGVDFSM
jgi:predicted MFS family arabinose efflux permease